MNISYAGKQLQATTRYKRLLYVRDQNNKRRTSESWFETGKMDTGYSQTGWYLYLNCKKADDILKKNPKLVYLELTWKKLGFMLPSGRYDFNIQK